MFKEVRFFGGKDALPRGSDEKRVKMRNEHSTKESMKHTKLEQIYTECLQAMENHKPCQRVSENEGGLDECKPFGEEGWKTITWTDNDKDNAKEKFGDVKYQKTVKCLKTKAEKIVESRVDKRTRMDTTGQKTGTNSRRSKQ